VPEAAPAAGPDADVTCAPPMLLSMGVNGALSLARGWVTGKVGGPQPPSAPGTLRHVLVLTDGAGLVRGGARLAQETQALAAAGVELIAVATDRLDPGALAALGVGQAAAASLDDRKDIVDRSLPPPGEVVLDDVTLSTSSVPAPARMIEVSGGDAALGLYADHLSLGQVYAGEARTEVARVALPPWVPGEALDLTRVAARCCLPLETKNRGLRVRELARSSRALVFRPSHFCAQPLRRTSAMAPSPSMPPLPSRREVIARARAGGKRIAAVLPIHQPRALLSAHGFHAVEIWGPPGVDPTLGSSHFQAYTCGIVRNATAFILSGACKDVDALLVPHTCDALQGMGSVLKDFVHPKMPVLTLYLPRDRRDSDHRYLIEELKRLGAALARISGREPTDTELHHAISKEAEADAAGARREGDALGHRAGADDLVRCPRRGGRDGGGRRSRLREPPHLFPQSAGQGRPCHQGGSLRTPRAGDARRDAGSHAGLADPGSRGLGEGAHDRARRQGIDRL